MAGMVCAQSKNQINYDKARDVLNKMRTTRSRMKNLQFEYEQIGWRNLDILDTKYFINPKDETIYTKERMVLDCNGLGKKDYYEYGVVDSSDQKVPVETLLRNRAWDGHIGVEHNHYGESPGGAILDSSPPYSLQYEIQPWSYFTGFFIDYLTKAIDEAQHPVSVEILPDGKYQVGYLCSANNVEFVSIIDPEKGFTCTKLTSSHDGVVTGYYTAEYKELADGVWFPVMGEDIYVTSDGVVTRKSSFRMSNIKVNDPNFSEDLFHIDLPKGTQVTDKVLGIEYVVGDPMSLRTYPDGMSPDQVARKTLDEMTRETDQKRQDIEFFIPKVEIALEKAGPFILSLTYSKLVNPLRKPESEESNKYLTELGKGDIAWDGTIVATRGAKVLTIKQESERPLKFTEGKWTGSYKLPEKVELPYSLLIVTNEGVNYLMKIIKIESGGITITYRELNPDESILYRQKPEDN